MNEYYKYIYITGVNYMAVDRRYQNRMVDSTLWSSGQPHGEDKCAEWNTVLQGLKVVPCSSKRGYVCEKNMF